MEEVNPRLLPPLLPMWPNQILGNSPAWKCILGGKRDLAGCLQGSSPCRPSAEPAMGALDPPLLHCPSSVPVGEGSCLPALLRLAWAMASCRCPPARPCGAAHSHSCPAPTSRGRAACAAASPCGPARNTWPALPATVRATAEGRGADGAVGVGRLHWGEGARAALPALRPAALPCGPGSG